MADQWQDMDESEIEHALTSAFGGMWRSWVSEKAPFKRAAAQFAEGKDGREHHPFGFSMWLAGGGIKGGLTHGSTDEFGWYAVDKKVHVHDLHATILHLMGINHEKLTYRYSGRDYRLTDVYGSVVREITA